MTSECLPADSPPLNRHQLCAIGFLFPFHSVTSVSPW